MLRIFDIEWWNEIFQSLGRNRRRSIFTAMGVVWGTFMLILLLGVGTGMSKIVIGEMDSPASRSVYIFPQQTSIPYKGMKSGRWWNIRYSDTDAVRNIPGVEYVGAIGPFRDFKLIYGNVSHDSYTLSYDIDYQAISGIRAVEGRLLNRIDMTQRRKVCLVPVSMSPRIDNGNSLIGKNVKIGNTYFTVVGTYASGDAKLQMSDADRTVIIPYTTDAYLFGGGKMNVSTFALSGRADADLSMIEKECKKTLGDIHTISPDDDKAFMSFNTKELLDKMNGLFAGIIFLTWFVGAGTLLAGVIGISNIMLIIVRERRQEIGVRRALGARPNEIIGQVLAESTVLSLCAGIFGMTMAILVQGVMDKTLLPSLMENAMTGAAGNSFQLPFGTALLSFAIILAGSLAAGILPAYKAIRIKAVDALREE